jgi:uncharacterized protein (DUF302 family)
MKNRFLLTLFALSLSTAASADIIKKASAHSVKETMDKFETLVKSKGFGIFARVDHKKNAAGIDMKMNDAEVLIFGNPKGGTVLMNKDIGMSLDLPLRVAVYKDSDGKVWLSYHDPKDFTANHDVAGVPVIDKVAAGLDKLTTAVTK